MFFDLVKANRSYRRFYENEPVTYETLRKLIEYTRYTASGANKQALQYYISAAADTNDQIFANIAWAAYLRDWNGPQPGERPAAYIVVLQSTDYRMATPADLGISAQTILLGAAEQGLGGCMIANIRKKDLCLALGLPDNLEIIMVIAVGKPKETVTIEDMGPEDSIKYWRDEQNVHHVPKRLLRDLIINYHE